MVVELCPKCETIMFRISKPYKKVNILGKVRDLMVYKCSKRSCRTESYVSHSLWASEKIQGYMKNKETTKVSLLNMIDWLSAFKSDYYLFSFEDMIEILKTVVELGE